MLLLRVDPKKPDVRALKEAAAVLKRGGLVVYPTETAYALGCDPKNARAVRRLFALKKRDASKPLPMIAATAGMALRAARPDAYAKMLGAAFWPGSLTIVARKRGAFAPGVASKKGEVAVRVSPHPIAAALSKALGRPVVSTSANRSGGTTRYDVLSILTDFGTAPDLVLDAGVLKRAPTSTIVRPAGGVIEILREGPVTEEAIHHALMKLL